MASTLASTAGPSNAVSAPNVTVVAPAHTHEQMPPSQTFQLTPEMEEGIKAAVAATNPRPAPRPSKKGSPWITAKYFLRGATLIAGVGIILAEVIVAIVQGADMDTGIGAIWVKRHSFPILTTCESRLTKAPGSDIRFLAHVEANWVDKEEGFREPYAIEPDH
ncbi:hypothetical protein PG991_014041 [Apiospora marii]|uniref:Uncharacterized protein n=1 Tax=Apiospora marii TaxID=335849 RepID=A0ABR1R7U0_9PEZI